MPPGLCLPLRDRLRDKALLVGLEYPDALSYGVRPLHGVREDLDILRTYLVEAAGYEEANVKVITDVDGPYVTCMDVELGIQWLLLDAKRGDRLFFYFAGHGYQIPARPGSSEIDGHDECILINPCHGEPFNEDGTPINRWTSTFGLADHSRMQGVLVDNHLYKLLVAPLPPGVHLSTFWDACHSGTILDLPYHWCRRGSRFKRMTPLNFVLQDYPRIQNVPMRSVPEEEITVRRCDSPFPFFGNESGESPLDLPVVISIASSEDYQPTFGEGGSSLARCLVAVHGRSRQRELTIDALMSELHMEMCQRRLNEFTRQCRSPMTSKQTQELKAVQCPVLGSLYPKPRKQIFVL